MSGGLTREIQSKFNQVLDFSEGLAAVLSRDGLWGYTDKRGVLVIPARYEMASQFTDGLSLVSPCEGGDTCYIDKAGRKTLVLNLSGPQWSFSDGLTGGILGGILVTAHSITVVYYNSRNNTLPSPLHEIVTLHSIQCAREHPADRLNTNPAFSMAEAHGGYMIANDATSLPAFAGVLHFLIRRPPHNAISSFAKTWRVHVS